MVKYEWNLGRATDAVKGFEMGTGKHNCIAIIEDKGSLKQSSLFHAGIGIRQLDVVRLDKLMPREQADAVMASAELDGRPEQPLHAAIVGQLGDEISAVLMGTVGAMGILVNLLQSDEVGLVLLDEQPDLLQTGVVASMEVEGHDLDGVAVTLGKGCTGQQPCRNQEYVT